METLKNVRDYVDYIKTTAEGVSVYADITDLTVSQYEKLMRHFDGVEITVYPGRRIGDPVDVVIKEWENPLYSEVLITPEILSSFIKNATEEHKTVISHCVCGNTEIYTSYFAFKDSHKYDFALDRITTVDGYIQII